MNRLDRHVGTVRSKLAIEQFVLALGYALAAFCGVVLLCILVDRFFWLHLPKTQIWFWSGVVVALAVATAVAVARRPTAHQAAVFIDDKLQLNEKFSTALFARDGAMGGDPFAMAAIKDAEKTADNVSLHRRFPVSFPVSGYMAMGAAVLVFLIGMFLPRMDLFGLKEKQAAAQKAAMVRQDAVAHAQAVLTTIQSLPKSVQANQKVELATKEAQHALDQPVPDPTIVKLTSEKAREEANAAKMEEIKSNQAYTQAQAEKAEFNSLNPSMDDKGPVADASRDIANADFSKAEAELQSLPEKFNEMTPDQQQKAAQQMQSIAQQLKKIANDPAAMQHLQQQMQQQGVNPQQAQQMAKAIQQAAQGNPQAQQQLQKMQQQITQQMNNGKGPTQQQQQQIAKAMQQMQGIAMSQAKAQQMTSAAQQMARAMQSSQASSQSQQAKGSQQQQAGKMAGAQGGKQAGQPSNSQGGSQQANGSQPGGQQPGQGQGQNPQQQMQQASQQMAQALGEMDAVQKDSEQQQMAKNSGDQQELDTGNGTDSNPGTDMNGPANQGPGQMGPPNHNGNGMGGPGHGRGGVGKRELAEYSIKQELDPSQNIAGGKVLAKSFVKADQVVGKSTIQLSDAQKAAVKESTDDVSEESVPQDAQKVVKDYFDTVSK